MILYIEATLAPECCLRKHCMHFLVSLPGRTNTVALLICYVGTHLTFVQWHRQCDIGNHQLTTCELASDDVNQSKTLVPDATNTSRLHYGHDVLLQHYCGRKAEFAAPMPERRVSHIMLRTTVRLRGWSVDGLPKGQRLEQPANHSMWAVCGGMQLDMHRI
jgi:hypothetical protein